MNDSTQELNLIEIIQTELSALRQSLDSISIQNHDINRRLDAQERLTTEHDKILVRGNPSLQEVVRNLSTTLNGFIEAVNKDMEERKHREEVSSKERKEEQNKWKWLIVTTLIVPIVFKILEFVF